MKRLLIIYLCLFPLVCHAQGWKLDYDVSVRLAGSTGQYMPFWARTGECGILPVASSGLVTAGTSVGYDFRKGFFVEAGARLAGAVAVDNPLMSGRAEVMADRLYVSGGWKMLHLDVGMKPRLQDLGLGHLSVSGGSFMLSGNTRNFPGLNVWSDWIYFEKGHWVGIKGNLAHYQMIDNRYVKNALLHNKSVAVKIALGRKVDLTGGFEHWAQWGGESPRYGAQPAGFDNFIKVFFAKKGGSGATLSDQINVLGNHLGREWFCIDWKAEDFTMSVQYDKPFEDTSGMQFRNFPDGVWSLKFSFADRDAFVTDLVAEFINTTWQTGPKHDRPATEEEKAEQDPDDYYYGKIVLGGCDNYFANGEYASGWTYYGRVIGLPLILPDAPGEDGIVRDFVNTRLRAWHLGLEGIAFKKIPYVFKATFSSNWGTYGKTRFASRPWQLSLGLDLEFGRRLMNCPVKFVAGVYGDVGKVYQNSAGLAFRVIYSGSRSFGTR